MTGTMEDPRPVGLDEKAVHHHQESGSDLDRRHSHQEVVASDGNEADLHESEKDIPVCRQLMDRLLLWVTLMVIT